MKAGIPESSTNHGYRSIHQKLRHNGIKTDRERVRLCLKAEDQEDVKRRKAMNGECIYLGDQTSCGI